MLLQSPEHNVHHMANVVSLLLESVGNASVHSDAVLLKPGVVWYGTEVNHSILHIIHTTER